MRGDLTISLTGPDGKILSLAAIHREVFAVVIAHCGSASAAARALSVSRETVRRLRHQRTTKDRSIEERRAMVARAIERYGNVTRARAYLGMSNAVIYRLGAAEVMARLRPPDNSNLSTGHAVPTKAPHSRGAHGSP